MLGITATAAGAKQPILWESCHAGEAAGNCKIPRGIATDPKNGHLFIADQKNLRVNEFTAWGEFEKSWGWGVADGSNELQTCESLSGCRVGIAGDGRGQFNFAGAQGVATDSGGGIYVADVTNHRVQKFNRDGDFIWMIGRNVNKTKVEAVAPQADRNLCPVDPGDVCQAGSEGTGKSEFSSWTFGSFIAVGPEDALFVADKGRIQQFAVTGVFETEIDLPKDEEVGALAADPVSGDLYFSYTNLSLLVLTEANHDVFRLDVDSKAVVSTVEVAIPQALATGPDGSLFVFDEGSTVDLNANHRSRILKFSPAGVFEEEVVANASQADQDEFEFTTGLATGSVCFQGSYDLYLSNSTENSFVKAYGPPPNNLTGKGEVCAPPEEGPTIISQYASAVGSDNATLGASINPHFWADTRYFVEYGTAKCSEGGCTTTVPAAPGQLLGAGIVNKPVTTAGIDLTGLSPGTTYYFRFVAASGGGGPTVGDEGSFITYNAPVASACPSNQGFRIGASASLADCRAYEMVSPIDKEGGDIVGGGGEETGSGLPLSQSSLSGYSFTYSSYRAFGDPSSSPWASQYMARRDSQRGWLNEPISPPQEGAPLSTEIGAVQLDKLFKAFSPDLSVGWNETITEPVLGPGGVAGYSNLYRRDNDTGSYEACTTAAPIEAEGVKYPPELEGVTPDQQHAVFKLRAKLTPEASKTVDQLYLCSFEPGGAAIDLVSVLPNGTASAALDNAVGTPTLAQNSVNRILSYSWLDNAISDDGSRVFWSLVTKAEVPEALYVRVNATQEQSSFSGGKCNKFFKACTYALSAPEAGRFWGATPSGSQALFAVEAGPQSGNLYLFDVAKAIAGEEPRTLIAGKTEGVLGVSEDLDRIYFASRETIGGEGTAGKPNLYLYEAGSTAFIGTLSEIDTNEKEIPSPVSTAPVFHLAHVTEDGGVLVFSSDSPSLAEETADYENTDLTSGEPASEIYRYQVGGGLTCLSCDPSGVRPSAARHIGTKNASKYLAAALPTWTSSLYPGNALSSDGSRLYFESFVPLALGDVNGMGDIYQWELSGTGGCDEASPTYVEASGGCLDLISSGQSAWDSKFMDASASGDDVFFTTAESLVSQDPGSIDAYDARVGGGFPPPPPPRPDCEGDCQTLTPPSADPPPTSSEFHGPGNLTEGAKPKHCRKGTHKVKRKGKVRCAKNKKHHKKHKQGQSGRAGR